MTSPSSDFELSHLSLTGSNTWDTPVYEDSRLYWNSVLLSSASMVNFPPSPSDRSSTSSSASMTTPHYNTYTSSYAAPYFTPYTSPSYTFSSPPLHRTQTSVPLTVTCTAPLIAPKPLPYHSPTFLKFDLLPEIDEDLSYPPYCQRPKRKRGEDGNEGAFVMRKRSKDMACERPPRPPSVSTGRRKITVSTRTRHR
ncbi:hypothetical protein Moror_9082 [Moniliophthora roreri MCA 2997]|uniref:Uncharacterized protein n=2 Tax=Moniliophthora roreri TaxID=221103 RepID=V2YMG3_MONRO|nr:hypothetical protein Moror_9082 [Moniliophthora roreri MCA 2997]KAI3607542.1 hypothetical protein WG66_005223 [Moniliophthora roreri]